MKGCGTALLVGLVVVVLGYLILAASTPQTARSTYSVPAAQPTTHRVSYEADGGRGSLTYENAGGSTEQVDNMLLPWHLDFNAASGQFLYVSVQNEFGGGIVSCRITVDGKTLKQAESVGAYVIASCSGSVP